MIRTVISAARVILLVRSIPGKVKVIEISEFHILIRSGGETGRSRPKINQQVITILMLKSTGNVAAPPG